MSVQQILFGLLEFLVSIFLSFILVFGSYRLFLILTPKFGEERQLKKKNTAVGIVLGSILFGEAIIVKQAIYPVMAVSQIFIVGEERSLVTFFKIASFSFGYVVLAGALAIVCIILILWLFNRMTPRIDQFEEIKENNVAVAVLMALCIIGVCLLMSEGVSGLTKALIPFPSVGSVPLG